MKLLLYYQYVIIHIMKKKGEERCTYFVACAEGREARPPCGNVTETIGSPFYSNERQCTHTNASNDKMASLVKEAGEVDVDQGNKKVANSNTLTISIPSTGSRKKHSSGGNIFYRMVFPMKYTYYNLQIEITGSSNKTFTVERRYSEFYILHRLLRRKFSMVKTLSFPSKKFFVWSNLSKATVEERRAAFTTLFGAAD